MTNSSNFSAEFSLTASQLVFAQWHWLDPIGIILHIFVAVIGSFLNGFIVAVLNHDGNDRSCAKLQYLVVEKNPYSHES